MIKTRIEDYDDKLKFKVLKSYQKFHNAKKVQNQYGLSRNELIAILLESGIKGAELKSILASTHIFSESFIIISDTHIGSKLENPLYLKIVYDYALKNNIKHIFHAGDLLQSSIKPVNPKYMNPMTQASHLIDVYPESNRITNHILLGNHDFHIIEKESQVWKILSSRKDFDILGFKKAYFTWNNYLLSMSHDINKYHIILPNVDSLVRFVGHRHSINVVGDSTVFSPTLSDDIKYYGYASNPGFLYVTNEQGRIRVYYMIIDKLDEKYKIENGGIILSKKMTGKYRV